MRRVTYFIILSADGMYADPDGGLDGFEPDEEGHRYANHVMDDAGDLVMTRGMYDVMTYWDDVDVDDPRRVRGRARVRADLAANAEARRLARSPALRENAELDRGRCRRGGPLDEGR